MLLTRIERVGDSAALLLPYEMLKLLDLCFGDEVEVSAEPQIVSGMRYDFPKPRYYWVSGNPLRAMNETNIKLAKVLFLGGVFYGYKHSSK